MVHAAEKQTTYQFGMAEHHGLMPWQSHESDHWTKGSYLHTAAVATVGTYAVTTTVGATDLTITPGVDA